MPLESHFGLYPVETECDIKEPYSNTGLSSVDLSLMPVDGRTLKCRVTTKENVFELCLLFCGDARVVLISGRNQVVN